MADEQTHTSRISRLALSTTTETREECDFKFLAMQLPLYFLVELLVAMVG